MMSSKLEIPSYGDKQSAVLSSFQVFTVVQCRNMVFWDEMLHHWVSGSQHSFEMLGIN
jgi:hypothetical protein